MSIRKLRLGFAAVMMLALASPVAWAESAYERDVLVSTSEFGELQKQSNVVLLDAEAPATYQRGHIPGAVNLPITLFTNLKSRRKNGYPVTVADAEKLLGEAGIDNDTLVVIYGNGGGKAAAGLWFALDFFGHAKMQIMNGGFRKWVKEGRPVTQDVPKVVKKKYTAKAHPENVVALKWMKRNMRKKNVTVIDARSLNEYIGQTVPEGASRGGHIPGARHLEWSKLSGDLETFKSADEMRKVLNKHGITKDTQVITYCNTGIGRSSFLSMALELAGYDNVKEYTGSWEEWSGDPRLPIQK
ncbi:MAG: sulfurtransferase [Gammaproteobacteria bacterium]|nr:MAG: sulfurtransferase [Gammaproteobacteria bacterium]